MESIEYNFFVSVIVVCYTFTVFIIYSMFTKAYEMRNGPRQTAQQPINYNYPSPPLPPPQAKKTNRVQAIDKEVQKKEKEIRDLLREKSKETQEGEIIV